MSDEKPKLSRIMIASLSLICILLYAQIITLLGILLISRKFGDLKEFKRQI